MNKLDLPGQAVSCSNNKSLFVCDTNIAYWLKNLISKLIFGQKPRQYL